MALNWTGIAQGYNQYLTDSQKRAEQEQIMALRAMQMQQAQREQSAREGAGAVMDQAFNQPPQQTPQPGQSSQPMAPPQPQPSGVQFQNPNPTPQNASLNLPGMNPQQAQQTLSSIQNPMDRQKALQALQQSQGGQQGNQAPPYRQAATSPPAPPQGQPQGMMPPPQPQAPQPPPQQAPSPQQQLMPNVMKALKASGIPQSQWLDYLDAMKPIFDQENQERLSDFRIHQEADKMAEKAKADYIAAHREDRMQGEADTRAGQGAEKIDIAKKKDERSAEAGNFSGKNGDLMAALAERGVSLPAGFRSKQQQVELLNGLYRRNPDLTADQIADKVESGQIELNAQRAESRTAGGIAGKIAYAEKEIEQIAPLVREASKKVPRNSFVPWNKLKQYTETQLSDPDLKELHSYLTTLSNTYDMLAARGGTDMAKRAENRKLLDTADSSETLERAIVAIENEAKASGRAGRESIKSPVGGSGDSEPLSPAEQKELADLRAKHGSK